MSKHNTPAVRVAASADSFYRCGIEFTREAKDFPAGHFSEDEIARLKGTSTLVVVELPAAKPDAKAAAAAKLAAEEAAELAAKTEADAKTKAKADAKAAADKK